MTNNKHWSEVVHNMFFYKHAETGLPVENDSGTHVALGDQPQTTLLEKDPEKLQEYVKNVFEEVTVTTFCQQGRRLLPVGNSATTCQCQTAWIT